MGLLVGRTRRETVIAWSFVFVQGALLLALVLLPTGDRWTLGSPWAGVARAVQLGGLALLVLGLVNLGRSLTPLPVPVDHGVLTTGGVYRLVRHPIYAGIDGLACGMAALGGSVALVLVAAALVALFSAKARWEEGRLRERYPSYDAYARRTPRFLPGWPFGVDRT